LSRATWVPIAIVGAVVVLSAGLGLMNQTLWATRVKSAAQVTAASVGQGAIEKKAAQVPLSRIALLDISMSVSQAQTQMPSAFPEALPDMHRKEYSLDVDDPMIGRARFSWEWGCDCLEAINLYLKDYPTELVAPKVLIPCLEQKLGAVDAASSPPYHYYWTKLDSRIDLRYDTGTFSLGPKKGKSTQQGLRHLIETLSACDLVASKSR
jgi:hypothetical protein